MFGKLCLFVIPLEYYLILVGQNLLQSLYYVHLLLMGIHYIHTAINDGQAAGKSQYFKIVFYSTLIYILHITLITYYHSFIITEVTFRYNLYIN